MSGFPIDLVLLEGLRCITRKVNYLAAKPLGGRDPFTRPFEHEDEHVHEHEE